MTVKDNRNASGETTGKAGTTLARLPRREALVLGAAGAAAALPLFGRAARAAEPIKLGWVGPLSPPGGYAEGLLMKYAAAMAADDINAKGGVLGRPIEILYQDTRGLPAEGTAAAERLIVDDKVVALFGEFHSAVALAEMEVVHKYNVPFMACDVWSQAITAKGYPQVFRNSTTFPLLDTMIGNWIVAAGFKNVALLCEQDDIGLAGRKIAAQVLTDNKIPFKLYTADPQATDFTAQILRLKAEKPAFDFFFILYAEAGAYPMVTESYSLRFAPTAQTGIFLSGGDGVDPTFWKNVGKAGVGLLCENVGLPKSGWNDFTKAFVTAFKGKYKTDPPGSAMESYDAVWSIVEAIKSTGSTAPDAIIHGLETLHWVGTRGLYTFSTSHTPDWAYHQFMDAPATILQYDAINQSSFDAPIVWPKKYATASYLYKTPA
ncbi:MAG TPA: ABC transporter substrate-binding protein [Acetobacteraceae bacterium]|jgi:branched-chain amino acid transport system substrate-binding protein|nr:ABC transporter substrate-binding protein [Acetobacteraceae bacterium]